MSGHTLSVKFDHDTVVLRVQCHEQIGAPCRLTCSVGCECWSIPHEHELKDLGYCNAREWIGNGDPEDCCDRGQLSTRFPLYDGMPIEVNWVDVSVGYTWTPLPGHLNDAGLSAAVSFVRQIMMATGGVTLDQVDKNCVQFAKTVLGAYFHEASQTVGPVT